MMVRIRIIKKDSNYYNMIGFIEMSNCDGTFKVRVQTEGNPVINLTPQEVEPC